MRPRTGEKIGWTGGWMGGFLWVVILSIVWVVQGMVLQGVTGLILFLAAALSILFFAPWRHPETPYWKLMAPVYAAFLLSIAWAIWASGGYRQLGLTGWSLLWFLPMMIPFGALSHRRWKDDGSA